jgi:hypothetical protein
MVCGHWCRILVSGKQGRFSLYDAITERTGTTFTDPPISEMPVMVKYLLTNLVSLY